MAVGKLLELARSKESRLILALDFWEGTSPAELLRGLRGLACGVKIGLLALLKLGPREIVKLIEEFSRDYYFLADFKLADIPGIAKCALSMLRDMGFDGAVTHLFHGGVEEVLQEDVGIDLVGVVAMSHRGSEMLLQNFERLLEYSVDLGLSAVVIGATRPDLLSRAARRLENRALVLSPGVGFQGVEPGEALRRGADFEIVGRSITLSRDPASAARSVVEAHRRWLREGRDSRGAS